MAKTEKGGATANVSPKCKMEEKVKKGLKAAFPCSCGKKNCKECSHAG